MSDAPESLDEGQSENTPDAAQVAKFLEQNIRFFEDNQELLGKLVIPHQSGGSVSLIERQVASLRDENSQLKKQLATFISHAHENDSLFEKTRALTLEIIRSQDYPWLRQCIEKAMVDDFNATICRLWWLGDNEGPTPALAPEELGSTLGRLAESDVFCGLLKDEESALLFGEQAAQAGSAAVLMLQNDSEVIAVLAIANEDRDYYRDSMSTSMLSYIGEILAGAIVECTAQA